MTRTRDERGNTGEGVELRLHTSDLGRTTANDAGSFANVSVTIPDDYSDFAPHKYDVVATGRTSIKSARVSFTVTG